MIAIVVPAHNEEGYIGACVRSLMVAAASVGLKGETVQVLVVLDACTDDTGLIARAHGASTLRSEARNVGVARNLGARAALKMGARWLAFTDADSCVAEDWLVAQLALGAEAVCGTITVSEWGAYGERMQRHFSHTYMDAEGHSHVHGANLGVDANAYEAAGGFQALTTGEDVALVTALSGVGARIAWSCKPRVTTSARPSYKAPDGFGATLERIESMRLWAVEPLITAP